MRITELNVRGAQLRVLMAAFIALAIVILLTVLSKPSLNSNSALKFVPSSSSGCEGTLTQPASMGGYIFSKQLRGQQGASIRGVLSLQCWAASFSLPVKIVDPYLGMDGRLFVSMSELFDLEHFNAVSQQASEPSIATWEEFSNKAPRSVIFVVVAVGEHHCNSKSEIYSKELDIEDSHLANKEECLNPQRLGFRVPALRNKNFCIKRIVTELSVSCCFRSPNEYREMINVIYRGRDITKFTVVFDKWIGSIECQNPDSLYRLNCSDPLKTKFKTKLTPSKQLLDDARYYTDHFLHSQNKVAVMIRSEQTVKRFRIGNKTKFLRDCLQKTVDVTQNISETISHNGEGGILLTVDVGKFGTQSIKVARKQLQGGVEEMTELVKHAFVNIYGNKWTFEDYEKSFTIASKGNKNPVYIAALQRTLASQADCLILMGGGNFQLLALNDYLEKHPNPCVHFVCLDEDYEKVFSSVMQFN